MIQPPLPWKDRRDDGTVSFARFMDWALYDQGVGYYRTAGARGPGRGGDFFTSVSVGACFGLLLGEWIASHWRATGCPRPFALVEQGGHGGELLADLAGAIHERHPDLADAAVWVSVEPHAELRERQEALWRARHGEVPWRGLGNLRGSLPEHGLLVANELLDAFPAHAMEMRAGEWLERRVGWGSEGWEWVLAAPDVALVDFCRDWPTDLPDGWRAEARPAQAEWAEAIRRDHPGWGALVADYGFSAEARWSPERKQGSLRRYANHKTDGDVLRDPGLCDITADVDFGALADVWEATGGRAGTLTPQGLFLTKAARNWLLEREADPRGFRDPMLRQFQTLTHPGLMGRAFSILPLFPGS